MDDRTLQSGERAPERMVQNEGTSGDPMIGTLFDGKYQILAFLGSGGFSKVYKATHVHLKKTVAVKVLHDQYAGDEEKKQRLVREARTINSILHPNIVRLHDFDLEGQKPYLVMDFVDGASLAQVLNKGRRFSTQECLQIASQSCDALTAAHAQGVIHRDLKPANIMVLPARSGAAGGQLSVKLLDFGIAKLIEQPEGDSLIAKTSTGDVLGTPTYMSPEQCQGNLLDTRSDIYSLGCVVYELLTGFSAVSADTPLALMLKHLNDMPRTFLQAAPDSRFPQALEAAVFKALAKRPADRYKSAEEFKRALNEAASGKADTFVSALGLLRSRMTAMRIGKEKMVIAAVLCTFALLAAIYCFSQAPASQPSPAWLQTEVKARNPDTSEADSEKLLQTALAQANEAGAPAADRARLLLELCNFCKEDYRKACKLLEQAVNLLANKNDRASLNELALCLSKLACYQSALEKNNRNNDASKYARALANSQKAVEIASGLPSADAETRAVALRALGTTSYNSMNFAKAETTFKQAVDTLKGRKPTALTLELSWFLCRAMLSQDKIDEAKETFRRIAGMSPQVEGGRGWFSTCESQYDELLKGKSPRFTAM